MNGVLEVESNLCKWIWLMNVGYKDYTHLIIIKRRIKYVVEHLYCYSSSFAAE